MATFAEIIAEMGTLLGIEDFEPDAEGCCIISSEEAEISIMYCPDAGEKVLITTKIMDLPLDNDNLLVAALEANHRFAETKGATISLDDEDNSLALSLYLPLDILTAEFLVAKIEDFTTALFALRERFATAQ
ncbi:MAG: type III secretion system chaperone [Victivallales bacterium]|nr:type III secretion system chaperone [Victivallales bacterium]